MQAISWYNLASINLQSAYLFGTIETKYYKNLLFGGSKLNIVNNAKFRW